MFHITFHSSWHVKLRLITRVASPYFLSGLVVLMLATGWPAQALALDSEWAVAEGKPVELFPEGVPSMKGWPGLVEQQVSEISQYEGEALFNVTVPTLTAFLPEGKRENQTAVLVVPGGGFRQVSIHGEGTRVAHWLAQKGIAAFVLKYRTVQLPGPHYNLMMRMADFPMEVAAQPAMQDAHAAMAYIRKHAEKFKIDPQKLAAIGFSAGAHVVAHLGLDGDVNKRPALVAPIYGAPFDTRLPSIPEKKSKAALPPMFLVMSQDDRVVGDDVRRFYQALLAKGYQPEAHFYRDGNHGFGMRVQGTTSDHFMQAFYWWLESFGFTEKAQIGSSDKNTVKFGTMK